MGYLYDDAMLASGHIFFPFRDNKKTSILSRQGMKFPASEERLHCIGKYLLWQKREKRFLLQSLKMLYILSQKAVMFHELLNYSSSKSSQDGLLFGYSFIWTKKTEHPKDMFKMAHFK